LALCQLAGVTHQSVAGFFATGSAGGSARYDLGSRVRALRFVDGTGQIREVDASSPLFRALGVSMGLLGVVTQVTLEAEPQFDVIGSEVTLAREDAPFDLLDPGRDGVLAFLEQHEYARIVWFPQPGVDKFVVWTARRADAEDYDDRTGSPDDFTPKPYLPLPRVLGSSAPLQWLAGRALRALDRIPSRRLTQLLLEAFQPTGQREFWDRWYAALPMDNGIDEQLLPFEFAELWFSPEQAHEALARLEVHFAEHQLGATGHFAVELYAGPPSPFLLSPGSERASLRINLIHAASNRQTASSQFAAIWELFSDMAPRLHWGKHLPQPPLAAGWIARAWGRRLAEFLAAREECDPDGVFLTEYFSQRLGVRTPKRAARGCSCQLPVAALSKAAPTRALPSWPLLFALEPVGEEFEAEATRRFVFSADSRADPEQLFDRFVHMYDGSAWMEQFLAAERDETDPVHVFDECFTFMRLRVRTLRCRRPWLWVARVEAASLPLASRLIERLELLRLASGDTQLSWTLAFDPHPAALPLESQLTPVFNGMFGRSLRNLAAYSERQMGIIRP
jgi:FAD/FMN-containing dehydrogenase